MIKKKNYFPALEFVSGIFVTVFSEDLMSIYITVQVEYFHGQQPRKTCKSEFDRQLTK